ncbi:hypothetical protein, partial [Tumebacillus lipolyticus]
MQSGRKRCKKKGECRGKLSDHPPVRDAFEHLRERNRALIRRMIDLRATRQESDPVPMLEGKSA